MAWEYKIVSFEKVSFLSNKMKHEELEQQLNELGREGWELVSAESRTSYSSDKEMVLFLKRQR